jgi:DnaJ-class molecular chaperone
MRVRGRGVPPSGKNPAGDLLVTLGVSVPKKLTKHQRALVEQLATALNEEPLAVATEPEDAS